MSTEEHVTLNPIERFQKEVQNAESEFLQDGKATNNGQLVPRVEEFTLSGIRRYSKAATLPLGSDFTLVYAENGVGKSTLVEALELIKNGTTTRSEVAGQKRETKLEKSIPSWGKNASDAFATISYQDGEKDSFSFEPAKSNNRGHFATVTRGNVRHRVTSDATQRYKTLLEIANLDDLIPRLEELQSLQKDAKDYLQQVKNNRQKFETDLSEIGITKSVENINAAFMNENQSDLEKAASTLREKLRKLSMSLNSLDSAKTSLAQLTCVDPPSIPEVPDTADSDALIQVFEEVKRLAIPDTECPVCNDGVLSSNRLSEINDLLRSHDARLQELKDFKEAKHEREMYVRNFRSEVIRLSVAHREALIGLGAKTAPLDLQDPQNRLDDGSLLQLLLEDADPMHVSDTLSRLRAEISSAEAQLSEMESQDTVKKMVLWRSLADTDELRGKILKEFQNFGDLEKMFNQAKNRLSEIQSEVVARKIEPIQSSVEEWWKIMAPSYSDFDLEVRVKSGTAKPSVEFLCVSEDASTGKTQEKHALGHMSDSQLDLLSLAIEFAGHTKHDGLLWLDDPTDMLDDQTRKKFCTKAIPRLIENGIQVALATHSREIVQHCWAAIHEDPSSSFGDSFRQVNIEVVAAGNENRPYSFSAPSDVSSARRNVRSIAEEIKKANSQWSLAARSMYANQLRRYAEFALAASNDVLIQICQGEPYNSGLSLSDDTATLGQYRDWFVQTQTEMRNFAMSCGSEGLYKNLGNALDLMTNWAKSISNSILNEGSHASTSVPTFQELEGVHETIDKMWPEKNEIVIGHLRAPHYLKAFIGQGQHVSEWNRITKNLRIQKLRTTAALIKALESQLANTDSNQP